MATIYHPFHNPFGTMKDVNNKFWYETGSLATSTFECCLSTNVGTVNGRPDSMTATKVKQNQALDLRLKAYNESNLDALDSVANGVEKGSVSGVEGMVETFHGISNSSTSHSRFYPLEDFLVLLNSKPDGYFTYGACVIAGGNCIEGNLYRYRRIGAAYYVENYDGTSVLNGGGGTHILSRKSNNLFKSELPHTDLISNPSDYPQSLKDRLASGKSIVGLAPLLVSS